MSAHPGDSTVVISLWQGDTCTGTFRMPAKEAARLISTLAYGMTEALPDHPSETHTSQSSLRQLWSWLRRTFVRSAGTGETHLRLLK